MLTDFPKIPGAAVFKLNAQVRLLSPMLSPGGYVGGCILANNSEPWMKRHQSQEVLLEIFSP